MNPVVIKGAKILVKVASVVVPIAVNYFSDKELTEKIRTEAAKVVAEAMKKES